MSVPNFSGKNYEEIRRHLKVVNWESSGLEGSQRIYNKLIVYFRKKYINSARSVKRNICAPKRNCEIKIGRHAKGDPKFFLDVQYQNRGEIRTFEDKHR